MTQDEEMTACNHAIVVRYKVVGTVDDYVDLWACQSCGRRFEPTAAPVAKRDVEVKP